MNKADFLYTLNKLLIPLEQNEKNKFLEYYEEIIEDYKEAGLSEDEIFKKLDTPKNIAKNILKEHDVIDLKMPSNNKILNIILLILGFPLWGSLLLAAVLFLFSFYIIIWCFPFITGVTSISLFAASIFSLIGTPFMMIDTLSIGVVQLGVSIACLGFAILSGFITLPMCKYLINFTKQVTKLLILFFTRRVLSI
ncbi:MAG: DUF1700 domain-containing protein [Sarcina sp.]